MDHIDYIEANIEKPNYVDINYTEANMEGNSLYEGIKFSSWIICDSFLDKWSKSRGFKIIKDRVFKDDNIVRRRSYICEYRKRYESKSKQKTFTKKILCPWHLNVSCPSNNGEITVNTIVNEHNYELSIESIQFQQDKIFNQDILDDIKFMTEYCNMGAIAQRKFLEENKDLYAAIRKFRSTKALLNDAATMSNWIDEQKKEDARWLVSRDWDDDNTLTRLCWMTPYGMGLSLFVGFNNNRQNILLAQGLLIDKTHESHVWLFNEIVKATGIEPAVLLTDSDPAINSTVKKVLKSILVKATFENRFTKLVYDYPRAKPYLDNLYRSKEYWAHSFTSFKFTGGMIATSRDDIMINIEEENPKDQQATIQQMFEVVADKYENKEAPDYAIPYLSPFYNQEKDFLQENLSLLEQKLIYGTLHSTYKKAISKALQSKSESDRLLKLLNDFVQERDQPEDISSDNNHSNESTKDNALICSITKLIRENNEHQGHTCDSSEYNAIVMMKVDNELILRCGCPLISEKSLMKNKCDSN
ncbi:34464_t:CDS:2, partial [Gigaspora margarita]